MEEIKNNDVVEETVIEEEVVEVKKPNILKRFWTRHGGKVKKAGKGALVVLAMGVAYGLGKTSNDDPDYLEYGEDEGNTDDQFDYDIDKSVEDGSE